MKERPIILNREMVRAVLDGRKTQTRRPLKPQPIKGWEFGTASELGIKLGWIKSSHPRKGKFGVFTRREWTEGKFEHDIIPCPIGQPGDRLWVRETWYCDHAGVQVGPYVEVDGCKELLYYKATDTAPNGETYTGFSGETMDNPWRPSIHMPRWASRILLEITDIRVERIQDISVEDAMAEIAATPLDKRYAVHEEFKPLWESIYGKEAWAHNDWVWVIEFKVVEIKQ